MTTIIARSAESVHWYRRDGSPKYTVTAKDGSERPTTLRDARKMDLVPSVTTILKIAAKPGLEQWKLEQMLLAALTLPRLSEESEKSFLKRIVADSKETGRQAAEVGTRIHESIEKWFAGSQTVEHQQIALAVDESLVSHFKTTPDQQWLVERSFADPSGFGGKIDMYCNSGSGIVLDVKTKEFGPEDKVIAYDEHLMQLAAYRSGIGLPNARCANVFVSRTFGGLVKIVEWEQEELQKGWEMFKCLLQFWNLKTGSV